MNSVQRFKTPAYRQRINTARSYRRPKLSDPDRAKKIKTWFISIVSALIFLILIYLVYFASFIKINSLQIDGASTELQTRIQNNFTNYIGNYRHGLPQRNFFVFSASQFSSIVASDPEVSSVKFVRRHPWQHIEISLKQRIPAYILQKWPDSYLLADDGASSVFLGQNTVQNLNLPIIVDQNINDSFKLGTDALPIKEINFIAYIQANLQNYIPMTVGNYSINSANSEYLTVNTNKGLMIMFDYSSDPKEYLNRLQIIWQQFPPQTQNQLAYIDLRFDPNTYTCVKTQPCAQTVSPVGPLSGIPGSSNQQ
jgi:cell division septal protein FtsQ